MGKYLDDVLIASGSALIVYGVWVNWPTLVWFAAGVATVALGVMYGAGRRM